MGASHGSAPHSNQIPPLPHKPGHTPANFASPVFFALASGSWTSTSPRLRLRMAAPVWHQDRSRCQLIPASCNTAQMVYVLTFGKPSGARRRARCNVFNDQVAVPSRSRSGGRRNSFRIRSRSAGPYSTGGGAPLRLGSTAASPTWLKRVTHSAIESPTARPTSCAASVYELPVLTASSARARATDAAGALWLRANRSRAPRSELVNGRSGSFFVRVTPALLGQLLETAPEVYRILDHFGNSAVKRPTSHVTSCYAS